MHLEGSRHCASVKFSVEAAHPVPFMRCSAGGGGYAINLGADFKTLKVRGKRYLRVYEAQIAKGGKTVPSTARRHFCVRCGSALWLFDPTWPELVHPHASAIDTPLPKPPQNVHLMLGSKAPWVEVEGLPGDPRFDGYPDMSLAEIQNPMIDAYLAALPEGREPRILGRGLRGVSLLGAGGSRGEAQHHEAAGRGQSAKERGHSSLLVESGAHARGSGRPVQPRLSRKRGCSSQIEREKRTNGG